MDLTAFANAAAVSISVVALGMSTRLTSRQVAMQRHANYLPALMTLLGELRDARFHARYEYVINVLPSHEPSLGLRGLPDEAKEAVYDVAYFFQLFAMLGSMQVVDEEMVGALLRRRVIDAWTAMAPFIRQERVLENTPGEILLFFEDFAVHLVKMPEGHLQEMVARRTWKRRGRFD